MKDIEILGGFLEWLTTEKGYEIAEPEKLLEEYLGEDAEKK